jgi:hypothetical protein
LRSLNYCGYHESFISKTTRDMAEMHGILDAIGKTKEITADGGRTLRDGGQANKTSGEGIITSDKRDEKETKIKIERKRDRVVAPTVRLVLCA